jgi:hypothetical protein
LRISRALLVVLFSASCAQSPFVSFGRAVDQAASWAAAIRYAHELESHRAVPATYLRQIVKNGAAEIETVRHTIAETTDLPSDLEAEATGLCDEMISLLSSGAAEPRTIDATRLEDIEHRFRALAPRSGQ